MRTSSPCTMLPLLYLLTLSLAVPTLPNPLAPRGKAVCANYPQTIAGTHLPRTLPPRAPPPSTLLPRTLLPGDPPGSNGVIWCIPNSATDLIIFMQRLHPQTPLQLLLVSCYNVIRQHIYLSGDGLVPSGAFGWPPPAGSGWGTVEAIGAGLQVHVWNVNNHQVSWGVLGAALMGLEGFMRAQNLWGECSFHVYDGGVEVGSGLVGVGPF